MSFLTSIAACPWRINNSPGTDLWRMLRLMSQGGRMASNRWLVFVSLGLLLSSCTATTGTKVSLTQSNLAKIKKFGILVKEEEDFSVRLSREEMTNTGVFLFSLLGVGIEAVARSSADAKIEEELKPKVGEYDPRKVMSEKLLEHIQSAKVFESVGGISAEDLKVSKGKEFDGILEVTLKQWGLRLCSGTNSGEQVQVGLNMYGRVFLPVDGKNVWERNDLYLDGQCHPLGDFRSREGLLTDALSRAIDNLSGRIVNDIFFP